MMVPLMMLLIQQGDAAHRNMSVLNQEQRLQPGGLGLNGQTADPHAAVGRKHAYA